METATNRATDERQLLRVRTDELPAPSLRPVQWKRLREQLAILNESDPARVLDAAFSVGDALGGMSEERQLRRFLQSESGQEILADAPSLCEALADREALASMPPGSLGRHFLAFSERHNLDPRALVESQHRMSRDYAQLDPLRRYLRDRSTVMHDLWHVLVGYDATPAGESALMCFSLPQRVNDRALPIFVVMSVLTGKLRFADSVEAIRRGRKAAPLFSQPFERLLPIRLDEVRKKLGISSPTEAHAVRTTAELLIPVEL